MQHITIKKKSSNNLENQKSDFDPLLYTPLATKGLVAMRLLQSFYLVKILLSIVDASSLFIKAPQQFNVFIHIFMLYETHLGIFLPLHANTLCLFRHALVDIFKLITTLFKQSSNYVHRQTAGQTCWSSLMTLCQLPGFECSRVSSEGDVSWFSQSQKLHHGAL